jgi:DNA-binding transcriptional regulator YiaG
MKEEKKRSDFAKRLQEWELKNPDQAAKRRREMAFHEILRGLLSTYREVSGSGMKGDITDDFGGQLFWVYLPRMSGIEGRINGKIKRQFSSVPDAKAVTKLFPQAHNDFVARLPEKLSQALTDLTPEVLAPLYQATGKKWSYHVTIHDPFDPYNSDKNTYEKHELVDGRLIRRAVKQFNPGAKSKITTEKIEAAYKQLGNQASQKTVAALLGVTTRALRDWAKNNKAESWRDVHNYFQTERK